MEKIFKTTNRFEAEKSRAYLESLIKRGETCVIETKERIRTLDQNALFHVWIKVVADEVGELSYEKCKRDVKRTLLGTKQDVNRFTGEIFQMDYETSAMTVKELASFMDRIKIWAQTELGCYLPYWKDPGYEEMIKEYKYKK